jgi:hypothetical protein
MLSLGIVAVSALAACSMTPARTAQRTAANLPQGRCATAFASATRLGPCGAETRSYSGKQLRQTGRTNPAAALQMLDPSITAVGH